METSAATLVIWLSVWFITLAQPIEAAGRLSITPRGTQIKTIESGMIFTCSVTNTDTEEDDVKDESSVRTEPPPELNWYGPGQRRVSSTKGRVYIERTDEYTLRLYITKIEEVDAGHYLCTADFDGVRQLEEETRMFLYDDIRFVETPTYERHLLGSSPLLQCIATGQPRPEISWRFNRRRILSDNGKYDIEEKGLRINKLDLRDNGTYECRAEVESHGNVKIRYITVDVLYPPVILRPPSADMVVKGQNTTLQCRAVGNPPVHYEWFREQKMSEMIRVKVRLVEGIETYTLSNVDRTDEGRYFCRVSNMYGTKEVYVDVRMLVPPVLKQLQSRITLPEGADLNISCEASGVPLPKISWTRLHGSHESASSEALLRKTRIWYENAQPGINTVMIRNVQRSYAGNMSCTAENPVGVDVTSLTLIIEYAPHISMAAGEQIGWVGQMRNFTCTASGLPVPTLVWYRGEQYISNVSDVYSILTTRTDIVTSTLTIKIAENQPWIYGSYSCMAKNPLGYMTERSKLVEGVPPDSPRDVSVVEETSTSVTLTATPPMKTGGMPITLWTVKFEVVGKDNSDDASQDFEDGSMLVVKGLQPDTTYTFYLFVWNAVGASQPIKFRATTSRQQAVKEQLADFPANSEEVNRMTANELEDIKPRPVLLPDVIENNVRDGSFFEGGSTLLGIMVGSALVLIAIMVAIVCGVLWKRRKHSDGYVTSAQLAKSSLGRPSESCLTTLQLSRRPDDPLPDIMRNESTPPPPDVMPSPYGTIKKNVHRATSPLLQSSAGSVNTLRNTSATSSFTPSIQSANQSISSVQQKEWDRMLQVESTRPNDLMVSSVISNVSCDLPPPPEFMLDSSATSPSPSVPATRTRPATRPKPTGVRTAGRTAADTAAGRGLFMDEILDGYISGDNVDDDIDQVDFTIRMPSIHNKMCEI